MSTVCLQLHRPDRRPKARHRGAARRSSSVTPDRTRAPSVRARCASLIRARVRGFRRFTVLASHRATHQQPRRAPVAPTSVRLRRRNAASRPGRQALPSLLDRRAILPKNGAAPRTPPTRRTPRIHEPHRRPAAEAQPVALPCAEQAPTRAGLTSTAHPFNQRGRFAVPVRARHHH